MLEDTGAALKPLQEDAEPGTPCCSAQVNQYCRGSSPSSEISKAAKGEGISLLWILLGPNRGDSLNPAVTSSVHSGVWVMPSQAGMLSLIST